MVLQWAQSNPFLRGPLTDHVTVVFEDVDRDEANERFNPPLPGLLCAWSRLSLLL